MSGPSSEGRPSMSSEPSATSSHTLNSRHSPSEYNGEGSSHGVSRSDLTSNGDRRDKQRRSASRNSESPLREEAIEEQDFAHRRQRNGRSGGFLMDSAFPSEHRSRQQPSHGIGDRDSKGKRSVRQNHDKDDTKSSGWLRGGFGIPHSSPLSREVMSADQETREPRVRIDSANGRDEYGELRPAKTRKSAYGTPGTPRDRGTEQDQRSHPSAIDPTQLVHMALNLSESRRRNLSAGQLIAPSPPGTRRVTAAGLPAPSSFQNYNGGGGGSLRQYLNEQRRVSRNISPLGRSSPSDSRQMSVSMSGLQGSQSYEFSEATLARRDKARAFIELRIEYLRLLEHLPPLKPDASAPGNFIVTANSMPGSPHAQLTRTPSYANHRHELGRPYNPLQYIRNRRLRARERMQLEHPPEEFLDVDKVRGWVDKVEKQSRQPGYRRDDRVALPKIHPEHETTGTPTKPQRPRMGWIFTAEELLADAHWLEQQDHKYVIEDRHGRKVFPPKELPRQDLLDPRGSKEYPEKRRRSWVDGIPGISSEPPTGDESETSERGRRRRLLPGFRAESPKKKHARKHSRASFSDTSDSDVSIHDGRPRRTRKVIDEHENTGPLALRMKEIMENETSKGKTISPALPTPDTPDKWGTGRREVSASTSARDSLEVPGQENGSLNGSLKHLAKKRPTDLSLHTDNEPRSSFEGFDSTAPNSPINSKRFPHFGADLSSPPSRSTSTSKKPKKSRLDIFRSDDNAKVHRHELESAGSDKKRTSRQVSEEAADGTGLGTAILSAPGAVKSLLTHKKNDSMSSLNSPDKGPRKEQRDVKDPGSAVTRFFKGFKNEATQMGEFIFKRDRADSDSETSSLYTLEETETGDGTEQSKRKARPNFARSTTATTAGSTTSTKKGHLELPSFRPVNEPDPDPANESDHITRQARERADERSPRFDRLAPPRMDLRSISTSSTPASSRPPSHHDTVERLNAVLSVPGGVGRGGLPPTPLKRLDQSRHRSTSRPALGRHWSITDDQENTLHKRSMIVTKADIARVQALLMCSGVKAQEIHRRAHLRRNPPPQFLVRAAKTANATLFPVSRKEEHVLAAKILVGNLESSTDALHSSANMFRENTIKELSHHIATLKSRVESELFPRVRDSGDEAVRITSEVNGNAPLSVKQITDEIDTMIRMRRRRMRWVRRVGWTLIEWALLGLMWGLWFVVTVWRLITGVLGGGVRVVKWFLFL